jgi:hypothetical protein
MIIRIPTHPVATKSTNFSCHSDLYTLPASISHTTYGVKKRAGVHEVPS